MFRHTRSSLLVLTAALALSACRDRAGDDAGVTDSALARDLTLASAAAAPTPELRDIPDSAPPVEEMPREPVVRRAPAPVRAPVRERRTPVAPAPAPAPVAETPEPTPSPAPAPTRTGVIGAGPTVGLTLDSRACSDANRPGDKMIAHTSEAVTGTNGVVFPAGSPVVIEVATVVQSGSADSSTVTFRVKSITANDVTHAVTGDVIATGTLDKTRVDTKGSDKNKVVGGAILGAVIGQVIGKDTKGTVIGAAGGAAAGTAAAAATANYEGCVNDGARIVITLTSPLTIKAA